MGIFEIGGLASFRQFSSEKCLKGPTNFYDSACGGLSQVEMGNF